VLRLVYYEMRKEEETMNSYLKHGVSAVALLAGLSLAYAQTAEHQGAERGGAAQHMQGERGGAQHQGNAAERSRAGGTEHQGLAQGQGQERRNAQQGENRAAQERGNRAERRANAGQRNGREEQGQQAEKGGQAQREETERQTQRDTRGHRTAKNAPSEEQKEQTGQRQGERAPESNQPRQRQSQAGSAGRSEELRREGERGESRANIHITGPKKTELHDVIVHDTGIHRLRRGDVHFSLNVGTRVPDGVIFYDPPARFVDIEPEFRRYKIIVLDDEILVIDPATREIVDVIPT
jgi:hypothetical protein